MDRTLLHIHVRVRGRVCGIMSDCYTILRMHLYVTFVIRELLHLITLIYNLRHTLYYLIALFYISSVVFHITYLIILLRKMLDGTIRHDRVNRSIHSRSSQTPQESKRLDSEVKLSSYRVRNVTPFIPWHAHSSAVHVTG
jgi:hypothetical protein